MSFCKDFGSLVTIGYLTARLSYTYQKAQDFTDKSDKDTYGEQISYIPWHSGSAILNAGYKSWELNYSFIYTGERYDVSANTPENYRLPWYTSDFFFGKENSVGESMISS